MKMYKLLFVALCIPVLAFAQTDRKAIQKDIDVLEGVLEDLLSQSNQHGGVSGTYLAGYGVIFNANYGRGNIFFPKTFKADLRLQKEQMEKLSAELAKAGKEMARSNAEISEANKEMAKASQDMAMKVGLDVARKMADQERAIEAQTPRPSAVAAGDDSAWQAQNKNMIADLKKNITLFFTDYASGIHSLPPSEQITVIIDLNGERGVRYFAEEDNSAEPDFLSASLAKSELQSLRSSRNPQNLIRFVENADNQPANRELNIFAGILQKSLAEGGSGYLLGEPARSLYVPGYGAVFFMNSTYKLDAMAMMEKDKSSQEKSRRKIAETQEQIIEQLAQFGGSLRSLKANEHIFITFTPNNAPSMQFWGTGKESGFSITAAMSDVQKAFTGELSLPAFKNTLDIQEY